ncbi:RagB/SusD family nutrient uptake outer membrane protein [Panacibacter ginsenosidivorans]|uniref:RagB/SusD family nutrient uptake outer membrane protein n=1 Tax=Panacibacter ginsenosidivorans TaxID=1813871 RepID=A0A5B8VAE7_9BACT|nr:RagB/SusD family nutrient uptake outer membrane protein [Panacibacter ginsenosidivorans]QEC68470.1 RagB/SusD family nutrient uptake outer membrane protein [Panacibacter ginsenosidivorans]
MKKIKYKIIIPASLSVIVVLAACSKDFLNKPPLGTLNPEIVASEVGVQGVLIGAYSLVDGEGASGDGFASGASNWIFGGVASDDANKGSDPSDVADAAPMEDWTITPTNGAIPQKWKLCYSGAQRCNDVLRVLPLATDIPAEEATQISAQARFLRAFYHFELKKIFGNIVYADENLTLDNTTNTTDVWPNIEADLNFAVDNLPETFSDEGRVNKWAAKALLAKTYMFQHKYSDAYTLLKDIIANGKTTKGEKYALLPHFYSNFNPAQKNSAESVFAAQTSVQDGSSVDWGGDPNGNYGDILNFPYTGGPGACCGFYNPSQDLADAFKTDANGLPLLDTWYSGNHVSDVTTPYVGNLDPRIDWTMGRKGIPYLDWGNHPGDAWIRNPGADGHFSPIKNVYAASQKDSYTDVGSAYWGPTELVANNVNIIRFADVILWAAECAADAGDLAAAMDYVNQVRDRVTDSNTWVKKGGSYDAANAVYTGGTNADTYKIGLYTSFPSKDYAIKAVQFERRLELAMEGHRFFDLVRYGTAGTVLNAYYDRYRSIMPLKANAHWTAGKNEYFPIPQGEIDNLNSDGTERLVQNPGY